MKIKVFLAVAMCKTVRFFAKLLGRGSSLPGQLTLKLFPDILGMIKMPSKVIAVTGSSGKTSTLEMIAHVLKESGVKLAYNKEGSNQIEGVTTFLLCDCTLSGRVKSDVVLMESDERYARHTFKYFKPNHLIITNLYRDQLTRNGHPEWVYDVIAECMDDSMELILNADDPLVSKFGKDRENVRYFGADRLDFDTQSNDSVYDDGKYCPCCKAPMEYDYYHFNHIGSYRCTACSHRKQETQWTITDASLTEGFVVINGEHKIELSFSSIYHCYNTLVAFAVADIAGISPDAAAKALSNYDLTSGRIVDFSLGKREGTLLVSKHENSISYDQSIRVAISDKRKCTVVVMVDAISRKYQTYETSWLWDIDFELLKSDNIAEVLLAGNYCEDLLTRFSFTEVDKDIIKSFKLIPDAVEYLKENGDAFTYVITCFSDKQKFLELAEVK
ncbi:MAG: MurT ligase domain-containing protein [Ruminococcus sp.]